ncbi:hypothetical protein Ndes2437B_g00957 [Nannochloris sp. 'desiccata']
MSKDLNLSDDYLGASPYEPASQGSKHYCVDLGKRSFEVKDWTEEQATAFIHEAEALAKQAKLEHGEHYASGDECSDLIDLIQKCVDSGYDLVHPEDASLDVHKMPDKNLPIILTLFTFLSFLPAPFKCSTLL